MKRPKKPAVNLTDLADQLSNAVGFIECAVLAMTADDKQTGPEQVVLEHGIKALLRVHADLLDRASD